MIVRFLVYVRYLIRGTVWKTYQREFGNIESAENWANEMSNCTKAGEEVSVLLYELKKSYN